MTYKLTAMDTAFYHSLGSYEFDAKCEILAELGFAGIYPTLWTDPAWADVVRFGEVRDRHGIDVTGVYATMEGPDDPGNARLLQLVRTMEGCSTVELAVLSSSGGSGQSLANSDPAGDDAVIAALQPLLTAAEERGISILLYPHVFCWMERTEDAVRLCEKVDHPALGLVFSGWHWYVAEGGKNLALRMEQSAAHMRSLNVCGSRRVVSGDDVSASIEPLDEGEFDNFAMLALAKRIGYQGPVLLQHYSVGGDVYLKLKRSLNAFEDMMRRLDAHPTWGDLRPDPIPLPSGAERPENEGSSLSYG
jgi:sugar phosphate isomerase/epimerase